MTDLCAEGLRLRRGGALLIDAADCAFAAGRVTAIMGANGAGKSLLLHMLHGLIDPEAGSVRIGGAPATAQARRRMALVLQKPVLLRRSTVENVRFVLRARDLPASGAEALLARVDLLAKADRPARALSGGEAQRLALARALATAPDILSLDEPTASLDPASALMIERIIAEERARGATVILVTHDAAQARRLADDVAFMHAGRIIEQSGAAAFFAVPQSEPARAYLAGRIFVEPE